MQVYKEKIRCTGCTACSNICPKGAIKMKQDDRGFLYPDVNPLKCIGCNKCKEVCHTYDEKSTKYEEFAYCYINQNQPVLMQSSSGALFSQIGMSVINKKGKICGAVFDDQWNVIHIIGKNKEALSRMRGSKYVQSNLQNVYKEINRLLIQGTIVLFTGTPCQVIGLRKYLQRDYDNLVLVDCICSSIPSPVIFKEYIQLIEKQYGSVKSISFRDKSNGWENYSIKIECDSGTYLAEHKKDLFMRGFMGELYSRPSCSVCPAKGRIGYLSDITIGDLWGAKEIVPEIDCSNGISLAIAHTTKGLRILQEAKAVPINIELAIKYNPRYRSSHIINENIDKFWEILQKRGLDAAYRYIYKPSFVRKIKLKLLGEMKCHFMKE